MTINNNSRWTGEILLWAGFLGASGVMLGAFGAHALRERLAAAGMMEVWRTAVDYQAWHALALLALSLAGAAAALSPRLDGAGVLRWAARCWAAGVFLFSGSLYVLALGGPKWLGPVTPLGGTLLIVGWLLVIAAGWRLWKN